VCLLGLELGLNIGQSEMLSAAGSVAGAIALVHSRDATPFPEDYGTMLAPGVYNVISLRTIKLSRMPAPYGDCIKDTVNTSDRNVYQETFNTSYSKVVSPTPKYEISFLFPELICIIRIIVGVYKKTSIF
jgi:hypothetical protein